MFMYNDAFVNYEVSADHDYMDVYADQYSAPFQYKLENKIVHKLHVRTLDTEANVRMETGYKYSTAVVISCLLAALKNIDDGYVFSLACKRIESQMGFEVDSWISPKIIGGMDIEYQYADSTIFNIDIVASMYSGGIHEPTLELIKTDLQWDVTMRLNYYSGVHKGCIDITIPQECIHDSTAMNHAQNVLWSKAYEVMPMMGPDLSFMRYTLGMLNGAKYHSGGFVPPPTKEVNFSGPLAHSKQPVYSGKDERVNLLPGVREKVKHPVTGSENTLERVIISLNDQHKWTREEIADWLDTLDIDLTFKVEVDNEQD
ncbi:hypothetical protein SEA_EMMA1919_108 [Streptomyces phage Emma1919]|nr:hypothetical protein SEA_EMMA1919_108 [Streptomyces phage Emma1919]